jgi:hypothetical protein
MRLKRSRGVDYAGARRLQRFPEYGVQKEQQQAGRWYRKAAEQTEPNAQCNLGNLYDSGTAGLPKDRDKAIDLYRKAAKQGLHRPRNNCTALGWPNERLRAVND